MEGIMGWEDVKFLPRRMFYTWAFLTFVILVITVHGSITVGMPLFGFVFVLCVLLLACFVAALFFIFMINVFGEEEIDPFFRDDRGRGGWE